MKTDNANSASGERLSPEQVIAQRSKGMHSIRFEFITRLLSLNTQITTLSIYWEDGRAFRELPVIQPVQRRLVSASSPRVTGLFDDPWLLCYHNDAEVQNKVHAELDRMVAMIAEQNSRSAASA